MNKCNIDCFHIEIEEDLIQQALEDEKMFSMHQYASQLSLNARVDFIGSLAQNGINYWLADNIGEFESSLYYDTKKMTGDTFDFKLRGEKVDIKGSPLSPEYPFVSGGSRFLIKVDSAGKDLDWYTFVKVDIDNNMLHVAGCIRKEDFWKNGQELASPYSKHSAFYVTGRQLTPFLKYVYKTF